MFIHFTESSYENVIIELFRDALLPKLMSGELAIDKGEVTN